MINEEPLRRRSRTGGAVLVLSLAVAPLQVALHAQVNFSGTWVMDASRTEGLPEGMSQTMVVRHVGETVEIETTVSGPMGEQRIKDVYVLDGTEQDYVPPVIGDGSGTGKRTSRWLNGRAGFEATESARISGPDGEADIKASRRWTLAPDGTTLTIAMTMSGPQGEVQSRRVFVKK